MAECPDQEYGKVHGKRRCTYRRLLFSKKQFRFRFDERTIGLCKVGFILQANQRPTDKQHLDELLTKFNQVVTVGCANRIWVPFVRSTRNATKWVFDRKILPETEITFYPWTKMNLTQMQITFNCMFFDVESKVYREASCRTPKCVFCQIEEKRQKFSLKSSCDTLSTLDKDYFLIQATEPIPFDDQTRFYFRGVVGLTQILIARADDNFFEAWTIDPFNYKTGMIFKKLFNS